MSIFYFYFWEKWRLPSVFIISRTYGTTVPHPLPILFDACTQQVGMKLKKFKCNEILVTATHCLKLTFQSPVISGAFSF